MKKHKEDKQKASGHAIETPAPPQVMNPSAPPAEKHEKALNDNAGGYTFEKRKTADERLSPREES